MPHVPPQDHAEILREVGELKNKVATLGDATYEGRDHACFDKADATLEQCYSAINETTDQSRIVEELQNAYHALARWMNGPAAPAVVPAREQLQRLWGRL